MKTSTVRRFRFLLNIVLLCCLALSTPLTAQEVPESIKRWEADIAALEKLDQSQQEVRGAVVFVGSSSIRLWESLADDMRPWTTLKRGYGGARLTDLSHYANRLIGPHLGVDNPRRARAIVVFVANDIAGGQDDPDPAEVGQRFKKLHRYVRQRDPDVPFFWIEVTPTNSRWKVWKQIQQATGSIRNVLDQDPAAYFIPTAGAYLGADGRPRNKLFRDDQLHLNDEGYELWSALIKTQLHLRLGPADANLQD